MRSAALVIIAIATLSSVVSPFEINGWHPCGPTTKPRAGDSDGRLPGSYFNVSDKIAFECAQVPMPLCHDGLCKSQDGEKVHVFVKRIAAKGNPAQQQRPPKPAKSLWFIQGGPAIPSEGLEPTMYETYNDLGGAVSVYTMDHRGTGRSHYLQCEAAQVDTDGSVSSLQTTHNEMPACLRDLNFRYKTKAAAFSITSAAMDLKKIIEGLHPVTEQVYVQGFSYGTSLVQRLVQLKPSRVRGFIFDGVSVMTTAADKIQTQWSRADAFTLFPAKRLLEACADDAACPLKFQNRSRVIDEVLAIYKTLDTQLETNLCSQSLARLGRFVKPSAMLRSLITPLTVDVTTRDYVPLVFATFKDCTQKGLDMVGPLIGLLPDMAMPATGGGGTNTSAAPLPSHWTTGRPARTRLGLEDTRGSSSTGPRVVDTVRDMNVLLYDVIMSSELFGPLPSVAELTTLYEANPLAMPIAYVSVVTEMFKDTLDLYGKVPAFCYMAGTTHEICDSLRTLLPAQTPAFFYKQDKHWDAPHTLSDTASALVLNGGLDFATPVEYGDVLMQKLTGGRGKKAVTFDYGGHCSGEATPGYWKMACRNAIVNQFVANGGDVSSINVSCLKDQPKPVFPTTYVAGQ